MGTQAEQVSTSTEVEERPDTGASQSQSVRYVYQILDSDTGARSEPLAGTLLEMHTFLEKAVKRLDAERQAAKELGEEEQGTQYIIVLSEMSEEENKFSTIPLFEMESFYQIVSEKLNVRT